MWRLLLAVLLVFTLILIVVAFSHMKTCSACSGKIEGLVGSRTRIFRGVGVANSADETQLGGGIITSQPLFDMTHTFFDGREMVSCDECVNPVLCQGCPNMLAVAEKYNMEPRGRIGAGRSPIIGTTTQVRSGLSEGFDSDMGVGKVTRGNKRHTPATARGMLLAKSGPLAPEPAEFVGLNGYQYTERMA